MTQHRPTWLLLLAALGTGCGQTEKPQHAGPATTPIGGTDHGAGGGVSSASGAGGTGGTGGAPLKCDDPHPGPAPISRLTAAELNRSVLAQIPTATPSQSMPWLSDDFDTPLNSVSAVFAEWLHHLAHEVALPLTDAA